MVQCGARGIPSYGVQIGGCSHSPPLTPHHEKRGALKRAPLALRDTRAARHATCTPRGARGTLPALRQRVQTFTLVTLPSTSVRTTWRFGFHVRRVLLFACETLLPNATPLSQWKQRLR